MPFTEHIFLLHAHETFTKNIFIFKITEETSMYYKKQEWFRPIKRNEIELFVVRWMDLESVIQSEVSQKEKKKYRMLTHIYGI